jgi:putative flippase GtrA
VNSPAPAPLRGSALARVRGAKALLGELTRFGSVGALAYVVDLGLFNLLRFGPGELLTAKPLTAKIVSVAVATLVAWVGNRYWTFADRRTSARGRELAGFVVVNLGGLVIGVGSLAFSHYLLGFTSPLADNISANGVGLLLGTAFRYFAYRKLVFTGTAAPASTTPAEPATPQSVATPSSAAAPNS